MKQVVIQGFTAATNTLPYLCEKFSPMQVNTLNPAQLQLIETFAGITSQQELDELTQLIRGYFARKLDAEMSRLAEEGVLGQAQLDDLRQQHLRTPYE